MNTLLLVHATGLAALAFNIRALVGSNDRSLRSTTAWASGLWAMNNFLIGAHSAAALSVLGIGRQASASAVQERAQHLKLTVCALFLVVTLVAGALTWNGAVTVFTTTGSLLTTYAMFFMRGVGLRLAMVGVATLWMYNAWAYDSWWQMLANLASGGAAAYGAWRASKVAPA